MLRIIAGESKNVRLKTPPDDYGVRPILARIRKSLFDILTPRINGAVFLDLFAGSGIVGFEALSRGAEKAIFVEAEKKIALLIERNLEILKYKDRAQILCRDVTKGLFGINDKVDIVFAGPPYLSRKGGAFNIIYKTLENILAVEIISKKSVIVVQHHFKDPFVEGLEVECYRTKKYGDSRLSFYRLK